ncbi:MAG: hypothetical protein HC852_02005 [Acaryochloridaceae cyanobacterium RU_4_10]|nr:hypothetical protein [Acaryochloridaceae cyanobacterium RU_4_10]
MERDIKTRGDTEEAVKEVWVSNVLPVHYELIQPQCDRADLVVSGEDSSKANVSKILPFL